MYYSIGEISKKTGISISTLRYYDKEGLFPMMERSEGGIRVFSDREIDAINIIECLKSIGTPIKDIKEYMQWCDEGDSTLSKRRDLMYERLEDMEKQMDELRKKMLYIKDKCRYYDIAVERGSESLMTDFVRAEIK